MESTLSNSSYFGIYSDSRINKRAESPALLKMSGLAKSTLWSGLSVKCRHTSDLSELECSLSLLIRLHLVCPIWLEPLEHVNLCTIPYFIKVFCLFFRQKLCPMFQVVSIIRRITRFHVDSSFLSCIDMSPKKGNRAMTVLQFLRSIYSGGAEQTIDQVIFVAAWYKATPFGI